MKIVTNIEGFNEILIKSIINNHSIRFELDCKTSFLDYRFVDFIVKHPYNRLYLHIETPKRRIWHKAIFQSTKIWK